MRLNFICLAVLVLFPCNLLATETSETLSLEKAKNLLSGIEGTVVSVHATELPNFTRVGMEMNGQKVPLYLDNGGNYLFSGNIIDLKARKNLTEKHFQLLNPIDTSQINLDDTLLLGRAEASQKTFVFTDPDCPFCSKLHNVLIEAVKADDDLAFFIIVTPLKKSSYQTAKTIVCNQSMEQLEDAFGGANLTLNDCESDVLDKNIALAQKVGVRGTPTMILPNGVLEPGYRPLEDLLTLLEQNQAPLPQ